ncbi:universal stress protein UspA-like protein (plasmid) [Rhodococcus opacus]|uniref:Universal stress protein UspA-like protein n=1 Tax=Rhodococcus opacus TaxID=37919 RepID=A0A1B1KHE5_RHOOP|nr:universal stress protein [Rhodococcus opacus]ANS32031.1 universal stress protein UspA-like protein [Rhodococcus opacus]
MNSIVVVVFVVGWILIGLATGWWMARRGHSPLWTGIAVALGPLFVPIAFERVERRPLLAASGPGDTGAAESADPRKPRMLIGLDGSAEAERALNAALALMGDRCGALVLAEVVSYDDAIDATKPVAAATERLASAASRIVGVRTTYEVLAGPPGETLRRFADEQGMDLLVVGRRGRGRTPRLLGSVSADLVQHARVPVLVVEPSPVGPVGPGADVPGAVRRESPRDSAPGAAGDRR